MRRLLLAGAVLVAAVAAAALIVVPALAKGTGTRLDAKIVVTNPGPLPACSDSCTDASLTRHFIYVENGNAVISGGATRADVPNAFAVSSIGQAVLINGVQDHDFDFTFTPPPNPSFQPNSGHWPVTASCPPEGPPCTVVGSPAILPGEDAMLFYTGWIHSVGEPNGTYVFKYTIHGTLNGAPVDLSASTPPIQMTG